MNTTERRDARSEQQSAQPGKSEQHSGNFDRGGGQQSQLSPWQDLRQYLASYARQQPERATLFCLGAGFILGWKLRPW